MYGNEAVTGAALATWLAQAAGVSRADLFVTSKAFDCIDAPGGIAAGCRRSLANLQLDYLDLYLLHAPFDKGQATPQRALKQDYTLTMAMATLLIRFFRYRALCHVRVF
jgi:diketogulonate reductase-like aldo/keto reductase